MSRCKAKTPMADLWSHHSVLANNDADASDMRKLLNKLKQDSATSKDVSALAQYYRLVDSLKQLNELHHKLGLGQEFTEEMLFISRSTQFLHEINNRICLEIQKEEHHDIMSYFRQYLETVKRTLG